MQQLTSIVMTNIVVVNNAGGSVGLTSKLYLQVEPCSELYGLVASILWNFKTVYGKLLHFVVFLCNSTVYSDTGQITALSSNILPNVFPFGAM